MTKNLILCDLLSAASLDDKGLLRRAFELRQKQFKSSDDYDVPSWQGMEFDEYDNLSAAYLIWRGDSGSVLGFARLNPTKFTNYDRSMIADHWPQTVRGQVPSGEKIYEGSRFVVAKELSDNPELRTRVIDELVLGIMEFGILAQAEGIIGTMYQKVWQNVFINRGWEVDFLGDEMDVGESRPELVTVGMKKVGLTAYKKIQDTLGVSKPVMQIAPSLQIGSHIMTKSMRREGGSDS